MTMSIPYFFFLALICLNIGTSYDNKSSDVTYGSRGPVSFLFPVFVLNFDVCQSLKLSIPFSKLITFQFITANGSVTYVMKE